MEPAPATPSGGWFATRQGRVSAGLFLGALALVLTWSATTRHAWEDFFISYRASRNLAEGHGLVYTVGERVHSFTSPLHTLLLALLGWIVGPANDGAVLWAYRLVAALALGTAVMLFARTAGRLGWKGAALAGATGLVLFDAKSLDFSANGMETPLLLLFWALSAHALLGRGDWKYLGASWAGMQWTRPDGFVHLGAAVVAVVVLGPPAGETRTEFFRRCLKAGAFAAVLYAPWVGWAWAYYGSPVPHTIIAKGLDLNSSTSRTAVFFLAAPWRMLANGHFHTWIFSPTFSSSLEDWGGGWQWAWRLMALPVWLYWLNPRGSRAARIVSLWFFLASYYGASVPAAAWYLPPYAWTAALAWGGLLTDLTGCGRWGRILSGQLAAALIAMALFCSWTMAGIMRTQQAVIETGQREQIGLWLRDHAKPSDTVWVECTGYIGYFSNLKMLDMPGLTSPEVVAARRRLRTDEWGPLIRELRPTWLVLRPREIMALFASGTHVLDDYALARVFDQSATVAGLKDFRGKAYLEGDQTFTVVRRRWP